MSQPYVSSEDTGRTVLPYPCTWDWLRLALSAALWAAGNFLLQGRMQVICQGLAAVAAGGEAFYHALTKRGDYGNLALSAAAILGFALGRHNCASFVLTIQLAARLLAGGLLQLQQSRHHDMPLHDRTVMQDRLHRFGETYALATIGLTAAGAAL